MRKHILYFLCFLFVFPTLSAQQIDTIETNKRKIQIGITGSVGFCNRILRNAGGDEITDLIIETRNKGEISKPGYTIGLTGFIPVGLTSNLRTGALFSNKGYQRPWNRNLHWPGQPEPDISGIKSVYSFYFLDIPLVYEFYLNREKRHWYIGTGVITNVFLRATYTQILEENGGKSRSTRKEDHDYNPFNISPEITFGRNFRLGEKMSLHVAPAFRYGLIQTIDSPVAEHLWNAGLNISCYFGGS